MSTNQCSLFDEIFVKKNDGHEASNPHARIGFRHRRNTHILLRLYYYNEIKFIKWDKCFEFLSEEFYLTPRTLEDIFYECNEEWVKLRDVKPSLKQLRSLAPHLTWL